jgi:hypothetical protein
MEGGGSPEKEFLHHFLRDIDPSLLADLLFNQIHGENRGKILRADRLPCPRMDDGLERGW